MKLTHARLVALAAALLVAGCESPSPVPSATEIAPSQSSESYRVLFLGNSIFHARGGIYRPFEGFCSAAGLEGEAVSQFDFAGLGRISS